MQQKHQENRFRLRGGLGRENYGGKGEQKEYEALYSLIPGICYTYLRPRHSFDTGAFPAGFSAPSYSAEDINGPVSTGAFPDAVYIKTRTQTFNTYHYYILRDGLIWYKNIVPEKEPKDRTLFEKTGLPHNNEKPGFHRTNAIAEISADADELLARLLEVKNSPLGVCCALRIKCIKIHESEFLFLHKLRKHAH
jgi:hypothetical protein